MRHQQKALKNSKKGLAAILLLCPAFILGNISSTLASERQQLVYEVYAGGIHALQATMDVDLRKKNGYDLTLTAHTRGLLGKMAPWNGTFESHGWILKNGKYQPQKHQSTATWRGEKDIKEYLYNKDGSFKSLRITDEHSDAEPRKVEDSLTNQTIDALTATLQILSDYNKTGKCEGESEVFDGKRRFKQKFQHKDNVSLNATKYNIYKGAAAECTVEVTPAGGEWHKKPRGWMSIQEQGRKRGTMPTVWIAQIAENGPAVPIKIRVKTAYGTLFMHLAEYKSAETIRIAEKRVTDEEE